jgi:hypothetical protein
MPLIIRSRKTHVASWRRASLRILSLPIILSWPTVLFRLDSNTAPRPTRPRCRRKASLPFHITFSTRSAKRDVTCHRRRWHLGRYHAGALPPYESTRAGCTVHRHVLPSWRVACSSTSVASPKTSLATRYASSAPSCAFCLCDVMSQICWCYFTKAASGWRWRYS